MTVVSGERLLRMSHCVHCMTGSNVYCLIHVTGVPPCFSDTDCTPYNAKCIIYGIDTQGFCRCSSRQMLDGTQCAEGKLYFNCTQYDELKNS